MRTFTYTALPWRVIFGSGACGQIREEVLRLGASRVLMVTGPDPQHRFATVADALGSLVVARFDHATMHTPTDITDRAMEVAKANAVDCIVSVGGGSSTGLSKALAVRAGYAQLVVPTTYSGSEVTPVLGETEGGVKTTRSSPAILPETVVYDPDLTLELPVGMTLTSAVNAMAHAVEAMYSVESNPVIDAMALQAISGVTSALPVVIDDPGDREGRAELLQSAWLAGICMASVGMGLHHKLCHVLGGTFALPHAPTHTVVLPYVMAFNRPAVPEVMHRIGDIMGVPDAAAGVRELVATLGGPTSLDELGFRRGNVQRAADLATSKPYPNPRAVTRDGIVELLFAALAGQLPRESA
jgi:alcohol dehydrogenase class IV